jgi:hypothetical protein
VSDHRPTSTLEYRRPDLKRRQTPRDLALMLLRSALIVAAILGFAYAWVCWNVYRSYAGAGDNMMIAIAGVRRGAAIGVVSIVCILATFVSRHR